MNLLVIGHSVVDHICDGETEKISPGGIYYSAIGFSALKQKDDKINLLTSTSLKDSKYFANVFENFEMEYSVSTDNVPHVNLYIDGTAERREHYKSTAENLFLNDKLYFSAFNGIYINMITGNDLSPEQFKIIRKNFSGLIYLDVHTLSRGVGKDQHRFFRKIPDYRAYLQSVDILQVNENELKTITPFDDKKKIINEVFQNGVKILLITKGENGAEAFTNEGKHFSVDALKVKSVNKIGCGDVFGSVFFYSYLRNENLEQSLNLANKAAGLITTYRTEADFMELKNDII